MIAIMETKMSKPERVLLLLLLSVFFVLLTVTNVIVREYNRTKCDSDSFYVKETNLRMPYRNDLQHYGEYDKLQ